MMIKTLADNCPVLYVHAFNHTAKHKKCVYVQPKKCDNLSLFEFFFHAGWAGLGFIRIIRIRSRGEYDFHWH